MQILVDAHKIGEDATRENPPDAAVVDAVLSASRSLIGVATRSLSAAEEETTIAPAEEAARPPIAAHPVRASEKA
jgi:hypothetical protein